MRVMVLLLFIVAVCALGQAPTTCVVDTLVTGPGGAPVQQGTIQLSWSQFTYSTFTIAAGQLTYAINNGVVNICLVPTDSSPRPVAYTARITTSNAPAVQTSWRIPTGGGPYTIQQVTVSYSPPQPNTTVNPAQIDATGVALNDVLTATSFGARWMPATGGAGGITPSTIGQMGYYSGISIITGQPTAVYDPTGANYVNLFGPAESTLPALLQGYVTPAEVLVTNNNGGCSFCTGLGIENYGEFGLYVGNLNTGVGASSVGMQSDAYVSGVNSGQQAYGGYHFVGIHGAGTASNLFGVYSLPDLDVGAAATNVYHFYGAVPALGSGAAITNLYGYYLGAVGGTATNPFPQWFDDQGVYVVHAMNAFDSVYQDRPALYNPLFTKFTPGTANYERIVQQWQTNVGVIGNEAGGNGTLRELRLIGQDIQLPVKVFANLGTPGAPAEVYCSDCQVTTVVGGVVTNSTCKAGGSSTVNAFYDGAVWRCSYLPSSGSVGGGVAYTLFRCINQNTVAGCNVSIPAANAPTLTSVEGASSGDVTTLSGATNYGTLSFAQNGSAATANSFQGTLNLASTWSATAGIPLQITWRAAATTGNALWQIQGQCIATGGIPGSFNASKALTASTANGTTLHWTQTAVLTLTTSDALAGCTGSTAETFMFRLFRDHQNAGDTITGAVELVQASFGVTQ